MRTDPEGSWIHFEDPDDDERAWLRDAGVPDDWVRDSLDPYQRPRFQRSASSPWSWSSARAPHPGVPSRSRRSRSGSCFFPTAWSPSAAATRT